MKRNNMNLLCKIFDHTFQYISSKRRTCKRCGYTEIKVLALINQEDREWLWEEE